MSGRLFALEQQSQKTCQQFLCLIMRPRGRMCIKKCSIGKNIYHFCGLGHRDSRASPCTGTTQRQHRLAPRVARSDGKRPPQAAQQRDVNGTEAYHLARPGVAHGHYRHCRCPASHARHHAARLWRCRRHEDRFCERFWCPAHRRELRRHHAERMSERRDRRVKIFVGQCR